MSEVGKLGETSTDGMAATEKKSLVSGDNFYQVA